MSRDGRYLVIFSSATNVLPASVDPAPPTYDLFLLDRNTGARSLVSRAHTGSTHAAGATNFTATISMDGGYVGFHSSSANFVAGAVDVGGQFDAFLYASASGTVTWVSRARSEATANDASRPAGISDDGRWLYLYTDASDHCANVAAVTARDVYLHDRTTRQCILVSRIASATVGGATGTPFGLSTDGRYALFWSSHANIAAGFTDQNSTFDFFLFDRDALASTMVTRRSGTTIAISPVGGVVASAHLSGNGRWVAFATTATSVISGVTDSNNASDVYLFDASTGTQALVSRAVGTTTTANGTSGAFGVSADGRYVLYQSNATNLVTGLVDQNGSEFDVYVYDRLVSASVLVSAALGTSTSTGNARSSPIAMSSDGEWVLVASSASNLAAVNDTNGFIDGYVCRRSTATCSLVTRSSVSAGQASDRGGTPSGMTRDGRYVVYSSTSSDVIAGLNDHNGQQPDLFLFDRTTSGTVLVNRRGNDATRTQVTGGALFRAISSDGMRVLYSTTATDVVPGVVDANGTFDVFALDRASGATTLVSRAFDRVFESGAGTADDAVMSQDGATVFYRSAATDVLEVDNNQAADVFVAAPRFVVWPVANAGGMLDPDRPVTVAPGQPLVIEVTVLPNYALQSISGCGGSLAGNQFSIPVVNADCTVTATFVATAHSLEYAAGEHGSLSGNANQVVAIGGTGTAVTAIPDAGYHFVSWSDASAANPRVDANVTANVDVVAQFVDDAPSATLAASFGVLEDAGPQSLGFTVADLETAAAALVASASASPPGLLSALSVLGGASPSERTLAFAPAANAFGSATVTVTVTDEAGATATALADAHDHAGQRRADLHARHDRDASRGERRRAQRAGVRDVRRRARWRNRRRRACSTTSSFRSRTPMRSSRPDRSTSRTTARSATR